MGVHHCQAGGCTCDCTIVTDTFTDLSQWTTTGTVSAAGGSMLLAAGATATCTVTPGMDSPVIVTYDLLTADDPAEIWIVLAREDANNFIFLSYRIDSGDGFIRLGQLLNGDIDWLEDEASVGAVSGRKSLSFCYRPGGTLTPTAETTGPLDPSDVQADDTNWISPDSAIGCNDENPAVFNLDPADSTDIISFGFAPLIPAGATDFKFEATVQVQQSGNSDAEDQSTLLQYTYGAPVGDNMVVPTTIVEGAYGGIVYGGSTDDWGVTANWYDLLTGEFGFQQVYAHADPSVGVDILLDCATIEIFYTTPSREEGSATGSFEGDACTLARVCTACVDGAVSTGLVAVTGDWDCSQMTYSYQQSAAKPNCPACECPATCEAAEFCSDGFLPGILAATLFDAVDGEPSEGTEGTCTACEVLNGESWLLTCPPNNPPCGPLGSPGPFCDLNDFGCGETAPAEFREWHFNALSAGDELLLNLASCLAGSSGNVNTYVSTAVYKSGTEYRLRLRLRYVGAIGAITVTWEGLWIDSETIPDCATIEDVRLDWLCTETQGGTILANTDQCFWEDSYWLVSAA